MSDERLDKVVVVLEKSDWHDHATETMWVESLGSGRYRLQSVPFFAYGLSYDDIVIASLAEGELRFHSIVERGGHSTYRIFVSNSEKLKRFDVFWMPLQRLGCTLERATERLFAIDVPPEASIHEVYEQLRSGEAAGVWDFEEGHVGHPVTK